MRRDDEHKEAGACASLSRGGGWVTLIDGEKGLENWNRVGDANWRPDGGAIVADQGKGGYLVSKTAYQDFDMRAEFWAATAIVDVAAVPVPLANKAGGRWNTYEISAKGQQLTVTLNGVRTVSVQDSKRASGPVALQYGPGVKGAAGGPIKWRKVQIRPR
jgi:hypothetical protein